MVMELHSKLLKYAALFGLVPYMRPIQQQQKPLAFEHHQRHHHHHHHHHQHSNRPLRWQQIYTVTLIVANLITTLYGVIYVPFEDNLIVSDLVSIIVFIVQIAVAIVILLETMLSYGKYYDLMKNYETIKVLLKQLMQMQLCMQEIRRRQLRKYSFFILMVYGSIMAAIIAVSTNNYKGYFWHALVSILIARTRCLQILLYLDYILYFMELINVKLRALCSCKIHRNYQILDVDYKYLESFEFLQNLKVIYQEIYSLHMKFNNIFGLSLAIIFSVVVLDITINTYWSILIASNFYESYLIYVTMFTLIPLYVIVFMVCYSGEQCEKQCNLMLVSLKRLLKTSSSLNSNCYNSLVQSFIMLITQNPINISANAYFTVNLKFLMSIFANIVTYLVILLQFRNTSYASEENSEMGSNFIQSYSTEYNFELNNTEEG